MVGAELFQYYHQFAVRRPKTLEANKQRVLFALSFLESGRMKHLTNLPLNELQRSLYLLINENLGIVCSLVNIQQEAASISDLAKILLKIITRDRMLPLLNMMIGAEFEQAVQTSTALRENNLITRLLSLHTRDIGRQFIRSIFSDLIRQLTSSSVELEVDDSRLVSDTVSKEVAKKKAEDNAKNLSAFCSKIFEIIVSQKVLNSLPIEIRALAGFTSHHASKVAPQKVIQLVGGYIMLRFINPALTSPELYDLMPHGVDMTPTLRRSLVLVSKVMQNLSNGVRFGAKESYMMPLNTFIDECEPRMRDFLVQVASDPRPKKNDPPFADLASVPDTPPNVPPVADDRLPDLVLFHYIYYSRREDVLNGVKKYNVDKEKLAYFYRIIDELGKPKNPNITVHQWEQARKTQYFEVYLRSRFTDKLLLGLELIKPEENSMQKLKKTVARDILNNKKVSKVEGADDTEKQIKEHQFEILVQLADKLCHPWGVETKIQDGVRFVYAKDVIDWLRGNLDTLPYRQNAVQLAKKLVKAGLLVPLKKNKTKFTDDKTPYTWAYDVIEKARQKYKDTDQTSEEDIWKKKDDVAERRTGKLTENDWKLLLMENNVLSYEKDAVIVSEGSTNRHLYRIKSGVAAVMKNINGEIKILSRVEQDAVLCEMSVLDKNGVTSASIVAEGPTQVWAIDVSFVHELFPWEPGLSKRFYNYLAVLLARRLADKGKDTSMKRTESSGPGPSPRQPSPSTFSLRDGVIKEYEATLDKKAGCLQVFNERVEFTKSNKKSRESIRLEAIHFDQVIGISASRESMTLVITTVSKRMTFTMKTAAETAEAQLIIHKLHAIEKSKGKPRAAQIQVSSVTSVAQEEMDKDDWDSILDSASPYTYTKDQIIVEAGRYIPTIFKILKGKCRVEILTEIVTPAPAPTPPPRSAGSSLMPRTFTQSTSQSHSHSSPSPAQLSIGSAAHVPHLPIPERTEFRVAYPRTPTAEHIEGEAPEKKYDKKVRLLNQDDFFGELSFLLEEPATASVYCESDQVELLGIDETCLKILFIRQPTLAGKFYRFLASVLSQRLKTFD